MSNLTCTSDEPIASSGSRADVGGNMYPQQSFPSPHQTQSPGVKRKRNLPGNPDPNAEVIALSPKTLMATNRFLCEICNKGFQRDQNLQLHRRGHNLPWKLKQRTSKEVKKRVYVCPEVSCVHHDPSRALGDLTGIKKHFSRKHGEKKWKCDKCSKKYAVQSDWKAHSKTCGTREYKCDCGTLFSRRDSFITHRAFCDALAEESAREVTRNHTLMNSSQCGTSTQHMNLQPQHDFQANQIVKIEQQQQQQHHQYEGLEVPSQWLSTSSQPTYDQFSSQYQSSPTFHPYHTTTTSPHMSATALLQKAAQMGATISKPAMLIRPQHAHMSANTVPNPTCTSTTTTTSYGLGLSSHEEFESGFMHSLTAFGNKSTASVAAATSAGLMGHLSAPQEMSSLSSESGFDGSSFEETFGGMLSAKNDRNPSENLSNMPKTMDGSKGGGNDGLTRDFLSLRTFPHRNFLSMAGMEQCMGSSVPYEQQNQNQKPWEG